MAKTHTKPTIESTRILSRSELFTIEEVQLTFSNGEKRVFERIAKKKRSAVMIVPLLDDETVLLVREYGVGLEEYCLGLPKGVVDQGETFIEAANRELMEEVGYGANDLHELMMLTLSPAYMGHRMTVVLAKDLYPKKLVGDEPEPLEVVPWALQDIDGLLARDDFHEARSLAALYRVRDLIND